MLRRGTQTHKQHLELNDVLQWAVSLTPMPCSIIKKEVDRSRLLEMGKESWLTLDSSCQPTVNLFLIKASIRIVFFIEAI